MAFLPRVRAWLFPMLFLLLAPAGKLGTCVGASIEVVTPPIVAHGTSSTACAGYLVSGAGSPKVDGCYVANGTVYGSPRYDQQPLFQQEPRETALGHPTVTSARGYSLFSWPPQSNGSLWRIGVPGVVALYSSDCPSLAPARSSQWKPGPGQAELPAPRLTGGPFGNCTAPAPTPTPTKNCTCVPCQALWGPSGCPDLHKYEPDLIRPNMTNSTPGPGKRVREVVPEYAHTRAYHALYLPTDWKNGSTHYPVIVEYMGNGPWHDNVGDVSTGRPEDSNLGYGISRGKEYIWISMPFLTADLGAQTDISTYWWGCPTTNAAKSCGNAYNITPTVDYAKKAVAMVLARYNGDPTKVVITGWSRGAIATGMIGLHDDEIASLWRALIPYSHVDGEPYGWWMPDSKVEDAVQRYKRLRGRPQYMIGECNVATGMESRFLDMDGIKGNFTYATTGFANHNDAWSLRPLKPREDLRAWLKAVLEL